MIWNQRIEDVDVKLEFDIFNSLIPNHAYIFLYE